jgi:lysophospholipase L1-like esterase
MNRLSLLFVLVAGVLLAVPASGLAAKRPAKQLYVSLGDSYATGYQATGVKQGQNTTNGFADQLPREARKRGYRLKLVNFGCGGANTTSILQQVGCRPDARAVGGPDYSTTTQIAAAERYIRKHRKRVGLITVSIGGNDVTKCASDPDPIACVGAAVQGIKDNVGVLTRRLRAAAGPRTPIVGITYPDVILGEWVHGPDHTLATVSVVAFKSLINPALQAAYAEGRGAFVDVTAATGAYGALEETTTLDPYGVIPVPVAKVCELTYYCQFQDIHSRTDGYRIIARLVAETLPERRR